VLNMFRTLIYPSSGAWDYSVELPHWSSCSRFVVCWRSAEACNTDTIQTQQHRTKNNTTNVVIQQHSRKLLTVDILMSETCWVHKKWNKTASDIKLVFYSSTITTMHGPININPLVSLLAKFSTIPYQIQTSRNVSSCEGEQGKVEWADKKTVPI